MRRFLWVLTVLSFAGCEDGGDVGGDLATRLAAARPGDVVQVGRGEHVGSFTVPAGVTLAGAGRNDTTLVAEPAGIALALTPGSPAARVRDLSIESDGRAGVIAMGAGEVTLERVSIHATRGIGLGAQDVTTLALTDVRVVGPITPDNAEGVPGSATIEETATHGVVLVRVGDARLARVDVTGFAGFGALLFESATAWEGGSSSGNLGTGVMVEAGTAALAGLELSRTLEGARLIPSYGAVFAGGASVTSTDLRVMGGDRYGLLHVGASARHEGLIAEGNGDAAVWIQGGTAFELSGATITGNHFAGVVAVDSTGVILRDSRIDGTIAARQQFELVGEVEVGDGVQLVRSPQAMLRSLSLAGNARVGILVELGGGSLDATLDTVSVDGTGAQLGVVMQGGETAAGWDASVTRLGTTGANDEAFRGTLDIVGTIGANGRPGVGNLGETGLVGIIDPGF